jgi:hypothetical protein
MRTWPMFQNQSNVHLFYLDHDNIAINKLLTIGTGLGNRNLSGSTKMVQ